MGEQTTTMKMRGRLVTSEEAAIAVQRLINSHFHNKDGARVRIPVSAMDDDVVASDYVQESAERIAQVEAERDALKAALEEIRLHLADYSRRQMWGTDCDDDVKLAQDAARAAIAPDVPERTK